MGLSEFEQQRQQNISRNRELFKKLNLDALSSEFQSHDDTSVNKQRNKRRKTSKKKRKKRELAPEHPLRRSTRLMGIKAESTEEFKMTQKAKEKEEEAKKEEEMKRIRLSGDISLGDVLDTKGEAGETAQATVERLSRLGRAFSMGDFYEVVKQKHTGGKKVTQLRDEFDKLELYPKFEPNDIRLTTQRMTYITFHPAIDRKVIIGGDTGGLMGIWNVNDDTEENGPAISHFKFHGRNIPKLIVRHESPTDVVSCSYDGSIRIFDINKAVSHSVVEFDDQWGDASGISDMHFVNANVCYFTTLDGEFSKIDIREKKEVAKRSSLSVLRLHDKKIGAFAVNPSFPEQIATASLDRTMRVWDIRNTSKSTWSEIDDSISPHCIGAYHSRLSVSTADWNRTNDIVINGYDNSIRIFQLGEQHKNEPNYTFGPKLEESLEGIPINLKPSKTLKHNCKTGRWVSILKARWQARPHDLTEKFVIGNMNRYFDIFDRNGVQLAHLGDDLMTSVPAVAEFHPSENWLVGGNASGKVFLFS